MGTTHGAISGSELHFHGVCMCTRMPRGICCRSESSQSLHVGRTCWVGLRGQRAIAPGIPDLSQVPSRNQIRANPEQARLRPGLVSGWSQLAPGLYLARGRKARSDGQLAAKTVSGPR